MHLSGEALPPELSTEALMDRYESHTRHCESCGPALRRIQAIRKGALFFSGVVWSLVPLVVAIVGTLSWTIGAVLAGLPLLAMAIWLWLGNLEQKFYKGDAIPPRNLS